MLTNIYVICYTMDVYVIRYNGRYIDPLFGDHMRTTSALYCALKYRTHEEAVRGARARGLDESAVRLEKYRPFFISGGLGPEKPYDWGVFLPDSLIEAC